MITRLSILESWWDSLSAKGPGKGWWGPPKGSHTSQQFREGWDTYKAGLLKSRSSIEEEGGVFGDPAKRYMDIGCIDANLKQIEAQKAALDGMSQDELEDFLGDLAAKGRPAVKENWYVPGGDKAALAMCTSRMDTDHIKSFVDSHAQASADEWSKSERTKETIRKKYGDVKYGTPEYDSKKTEIENENIRYRQTREYSDIAALHSLADYGGSYDGRVATVDKLIIENGRVGREITSFGDTSYSQPFGTRKGYDSYSTDPAGTFTTLPRDSRARFSSFGTGDTETDARLLLTGWSINADMPAAMWMHSVVASEFSGKQSIEGFWNPASLGIKFTEPDPNYKAAARWMYDRTQAKLGRSRKYKESVDLYRGVTSEISVRSHAESWSLKRTTAYKFNGHAVLKESVPSKAILYSYSSMKGFVPPEKILEGKQEFVVMPYME